MHKSSVARCCHEAKAILLIIPFARRKYTCVFVLRVLSFQLSLSRSESSPVYLSCVRYPFDYPFREAKVHPCICLACAIRTCVRHAMGCRRGLGQSGRTELNIASLNKLNICFKLECRITIPFLESNSEMHRSHNLSESCRRMARALPVQPKL
jgi:hypothetical protein